MKTFFSIVIFFICLLQPAAQYAYGAVPGDTLKNLRSAAYASYLPDRQQYNDSGLRREFYFPQYYIAEAAKKKKIKIYAPGSSPSSLKELPPAVRDSLFLIKEWYDVLDYSGFEPTYTGEKRLQITEMWGVVTDGYEFFEELAADEKTSRLCMLVKGLTLTQSGWEVTGQTNTPFYFFVPPSENPAFSTEYLTLKNEKDSFAVKDDNILQLEALITSCIRWCAEGKRSMQQNGIALTKKEAKKLLKKSGKHQLLSGVTSIMAYEDWYFNPESCAFAKGINRLELRGAGGKVLYGFMF